MKPGLGFWTTVSSLSVGYYIWQKTILDEKFPPTTVHQYHIGSMAQYLPPHAIMLPTARVASSDTNKTSAKLPMPLEVTFLFLKASRKHP